MLSMDIAEWILKTPPAAVQDPGPNMQESGTAANIQVTARNVN